MIAPDTAGADSSLLPPPLVLLLRFPRTHHRPERLVPIGQRHVAMNGPTDHSERALAIAPGHALQLLVTGREPSLPDFRQ